MKGRWFEFKNRFIEATGFTDKKVIRDMFIANWFFDDYRKACDKILLF